LGGFGRQNSKRRNFTRTYPRILGAIVIYQAQELPDDPHNTAGISPLFPDTMAPTKSYTNPVFLL